MEDSLRHYSVLSRGITILVQVRDCPCDCGAFPVLEFGRGTTAVGGGTLGYFLDHAHPGQSPFPSRMAGYIAYTYLVLLSIAACEAAACSSMKKV